MAEGFIQIAVENMANAIKQISIERGYDVTEYTLCCFGGAGGQHACLVADALGMKRVYIHPLAGVLSAYGMGLADLRSHARSRRSRRGSTPSAACPSSTRSLDRLAADGAAEMRAQGVDAERIAVLAQGASSNTTAPTRRLSSPSARCADDRRQPSRRRTGSATASSCRKSRWSSKRCRSRRSAPPTRPRTGLSAAPRRRPRPRRSTRVALFTAGAEHSAPVFDRDALQPGQTVDGPGDHRRGNATTVVEPGWRARARPRAAISCWSASCRCRARVAIGTSVDPVMLEVFNNLFMAIAEQMGVALQNTAYSVNIKERLDFSCALFDRERRADRQRAAHAGASGLDGRERARP